MQWLVNKKISLGFAAALTSLAFTGVVIGRIPFQQREANRWVEHTHQVLAELETTLSTIKDAETGQRGYLLVGDERYLEPYKTAISQIDGQIENLKKLTADNPNQQRQMATLEREINAKLRELKETINLRQTKGFEAAWQVVVSDQGKQQMDNIRRHIAQMKQEENQLLEQRTREAEARAAATIQIFFILMLLILALTCIIYYLVNSDITKRHLAEAALRESEQRFSRAVLNAPFPMMIHAEDGEVVQINSAWKEMTGYYHADIPTIADWTQKAYGQKKELVKAHIDNLYSLDGSLNEGEYIITTNKGEKRTWDFSSAALGKLPDGRRLVLSMAADVTKRKQAQAALQDSEELFRQVVENIHEIFWMTPPNQEGIIYVSPAYEKIWGRTCASLYEEPQSFLEAIHPEDRQRVITGFPQQKQGGYKIEYRILQPDGSERWISDRAFPVQNENGEIYRIVGIAEDITSRKQLENKLRQQAEELVTANRMKDEFLAIVSHELRTPLNAMLGWSDLIRKKKMDEASVQRAIETINRNAKAQAQLIDDLLDVSRMIRGKLSLDVCPVDLVSVISDALNTVRPATEVKNISLEFLVDSDLEVRSQESGRGGFNQDISGTTSRLTNPPVLRSQESGRGGFNQDISGTTSRLTNPSVQGELQTGNSSPASLGSPVSIMGDRNRLQQIVWNLLSNAVKFTPKRGRVEVRLSVVTGNSQLMGNKEQPSQSPITNYQSPTTNYQLPITFYAQIQVSDTGCGISAEFLPYVFDRFRQADSSITRSHGGLGLGLAIVRHLVELHGGTVYVDSQGEGKGTTFTVKLPLLKMSRGDGGDGEAEGQGDKGTKRQGEESTVVFSLSPHLLVSPSSSSP